MKLPRIHESEYGFGSLNENRANWAREYEAALTRPYPSALYRSRSGIIWQVFDYRDGFYSLRTPRKLKSGVNYFRFIYRRNLEDWEYLGPTEKTSVFYGYTLADPEHFVLPDVTWN